MHKAFVITSSSGYGEQAGNCFVFRGSLRRANTPSVFKKPLFPAAFASRDKAAVCAVLCCRWATRTPAPWNSWWTNMANTTSSKSTPDSKSSTRSLKKSPSELSAPRPLHLCLASLFGVLLPRTRWAASRFRG